MSDWTELKRVSLAIAEGSDLQGLEAEEAMHAFECAATPDVVLALIAENETLRRDKSDPCDGCFMADAEALRQDAERYRWLRDEATPSYGTMVGDHYESAQDKDQCIDAAMGKGEQS